MLKPDWLSFRIHWLDGVRGYADGLQGMAKSVFRFFACFHRRGVWRLGVGRCDLYQMQIPLTIVNALAATALVGRI